MLEYLLSLIRQEFKVLLIQKRLQLQYTTENIQKDCCFVEIRQSGDNIYHVAFAVENLGLDDVIALYRYLVDDVPKGRAELITIESSLDMEGLPISSNQLQFSKSVYFYCNDLICDENEIQALSLAKGFHTRIRDRIRINKNVREKNYVNSQKLNWLRKTLIGIRDEAILRKLLLLLYQASDVRYVQLLHGSSEFGKDLVVIDKYEENKIEILQVKVGDMKTKDWRQVKPQLEEIFEIQLPLLLLEKVKEPSIIGRLVSQVSHLKILMFEG